MVKGNDLETIQCSAAVFAGNLVSSDSISRQGIGPDNHSKSGGAMSSQDELHTPPANRSLRPILPMPHPRPTLPAQGEVMVGRARRNAVLPACERCRKHKTKVCIGSLALSHQPGGSWVAYLALISARASGHDVPSVKATGQNASTLRQKQKQHRLCDYKSHPRRGVSRHSRACSIC